jgi:hypothetical protein
VQNVKLWQKNSRGNLQDQTDVPKNNKNRFAQKTRRAAQKKQTRVLTTE